MLISSDILYLEPRKNKAKILNPFLGFGWSVVEMTTEQTLTKNGWADRVEQLIWGLKDNIDYENKSLLNDSLIVRVTNTEKLIEDTKEIISKWNEINTYYELQLFYVGDVKGVPDAKEFTFTLYKLNIDLESPCFEFDDTEPYCEILDPDSLPKKTKTETDPY